MENLVFGIITVLLNVILIFFVVKFYKKEQYSLALALLIFSGFSLRLFISFDLFLHDWDERYHALVALNMIEYPFKPMLYKIPLLEFDYRHWSNNHIWLHKQPLPLWAMAASLAAFGKNVIALRIPSIILSTLGIYMTYKIGQILFNRKIGFIAAFLFSINGFIVELTSGRIATDHIDVFFLTFVTAGVLFAIQFANSKKLSENILCGLMIGFAILSKWLPALIVLPIWILAIVHYKKFKLKEIVLHGIILLVVITVIALPWQIYIHLNFPQEAAWESLYNLHHITQALGPHGRPFYFHLDYMRIIFGEIIYIPLGWFFYITIQKGLNAKYLMLALWITIPYLFFSFAKTKMAGYIIFTAPAMFIVTSLFMHYLMTYKKQFKSTAFAKILIFLLIALPVRYCIERVKPFHIKERTVEWISVLHKLDEQYQNPKKVIFNSRLPIKIMFHSNFIAYEIIPELAKLRELNESGYEIFIDNRDEIPIYLKAQNFIKFIEISQLPTLNPE